MRYPAIAWGIVTFLVLLLFILVPITDGTKVITRSVVIILLAVGMVAMLDIDGAIDDARAVAEPLAKPDPRHSTPPAERFTICLSSQTGCAVDCQGTSCTQCPAASVDQCISQVNNNGGVIYTPQAAGTGYMVSAYSKNPELAYLFIQWFTSPSIGDDAVAPLDHEPHRDESDPDPERQLHQGGGPQRRWHADGRRNGVRGVGRSHAVK